jgi:hypothetical protein
MTSMFDPLNSTSSVFGGTDSPITPPWPTTPHIQGSPVPNLRRALTPVPPTPDKGPSPGLYGKEPQIYGQPDAGLISPRNTFGSNGVKYEKAEPYLRVRINGLDRNRRDILVKLDAQVCIFQILILSYLLIHQFLPLFIDLARPISRTSLVLHIGTYLDRTLNSNSSTNRLCITTLKLLYLLCL